MNVRDCTLAELVELDSNLGEPVVFHGSTTCFCEQIAATGWPLCGRPYSWDDINFVRDLADRLNQTSGGWVGLGLKCRHQGASFTGQLSRAHQYASQCQGGENLFSARDVANRLVGFLRLAGERPAELQRLEDLQTCWSRLVAGALPVVYAVRPTEAVFPSFFQNQHAQLAVLGKVIDRLMEYNPVADVPASAIMGRCVLERPPAWK